MLSINKITGLLIIQILVGRKHVFRERFIKNDKLVDCSGSGETPTGTARAEAPGLSEAREKAEAVPVESEPTVVEINSLLDATNNKR